VPEDADADHRIETSRTVWLDVGADELWAALGRVDEYPTWWPWLRRFDGRALAAGERWRCRIKPPLPWSLDLTVEIDHVGDRDVRATVHGDVAGTAAVAVRAARAGAEITLDSSLRACGGATEALQRLLPDVSRMAHDRVVDRALAQFSRRAL
jgi:hypothetical protein